MEVGHELHAICIYLLVLLTGVDVFVVSLLLGVFQPRKCIRLAPTAPTTDSIEAVE